MHCNLSALAREESRVIDIYLLLNTEILKKVTSTAGSVRGHGSRRSLEGSSREGHGRLCC